MSNKTVSFLPSQVDTPQSTNALTTTTSPLALVYSDVILVFQNLSYVPGIIFPLTPYRSGSLDELYPSVQNFKAMLIHFVLVFVQLFFILSVPFWVFIITAGWMAYSGIVALVIYFFCQCLNGRRSGRMTSDPNILEGYDKKEGEVWVFVNGVAVG
jgi:hypothetical protein